MPVCDCGAYVQKGVQCSQCELDERYQGFYDGQCSQCGTTTLPDGEDFCDECRAGFGEQTSQVEGDD